MPTIAIVLSGCGVFDGAEINEAVLTALALSKAGVAYQFIAPNISQHHVINHLTGEVANETRNVLIESARIARGKIIDIAQANPNDYAAVIVPGGFGAAKNLSDFAISGNVNSISPELLLFLHAIINAKKPTGYACIAPVMIPQLISGKVELTIGNDVEIASIIEKSGAKHIDCEVTNVVIDRQHKIVTTPAFMLSENLADIHVGIEKMVNAVLNFITR
jgi:enhancing lycopene biosynthesis protein 2